MKSSGVGVGVGQMLGGLFFFSVAVVLGAWGVLWLTAALTLGDTVDVITLGEAVVLLVLTAAFFLCGLSVLRSKPGGNSNRVES